MTQAVAVARHRKQQVVATAWFDLHSAAIRRLKETSLAAMMQRELNTTHIIADEAAKHYEDFKLQQTRDDERLKSVQANISQAQNKIIVAEAGVTSAADSVAAAQVKLEAVQAKIAAAEKELENTKKSGDDEDDPTLRESNSNTQSQYLDKLGLEMAQKKKTASAARIKHAQRVAQTKLAELNKLVTLTKIRSGSTIVAGSDIKVEIFEKQRAEIQSELRKTLDREAQNIKAEKQLIRTASVPGTQHGQLREGSGDFAGSEIIDTDEDETDKHDAHEALMEIKMEEMEAKHEHIMTLADEEDAKLHLHDQKQERKKLQYDVLGIQQAVIASKMQERVVREQLTSANKNLRSKQLSSTSALAAVHLSSEVMEMKQKNIKKMKEQQDVIIRVVKMKEVMKIKDQKAFSEKTQILSEDAERAKIKILASQPPQELWKMWKFRKPNFNVWKDHKSAPMDRLHRFDEYTHTYHNHTLPQSPFITCHGQITLLKDGVLGQCLTLRQIICDAKANFAGHKMCREQRSCTRLYEQAGSKMTKDDRLLLFALYGTEDVKAACASVCAQASG